MKFSSTTTNARATIRLPLNVARLTCVHFSPSVSQSVNQSANATSQIPKMTVDDDTDDDDGDANGYVGNPGVHENTDEGHQ